MASTSDGKSWSWTDRDPLEIPVEILGVSGAVTLAAAEFLTLGIVNPVAVAVPTNVEFGSMLVGTTSGSQNVTLTNNGPDPLVVSSLSLGGVNPADFSVTGPGLPITVPVNSSMTATVRFTPTDQRPRSAVLIMDSNGFLSPDLVNLTGNGFKLTDVAVGQTVVQSGQRLTYTITVRNNGPGDAIDVRLTDAVPAQAHVVSVAVGGSGFGGPACVSKGDGTFACRLSNLVSGGYATITLKVDVTAVKPIQISNTVTVSLLNELNTRNNSSTLVTTTSCTTAPLC